MKIKIIVVFLSVAFPLLLIAFFWHGPSKELTVLNKTWKAFLQNNPQAMREGLAELKEIKGANKRWSPSLTLLQQYLESPTPKTLLALQKTTWPEFPSSDMAFPPHWFELQKAALEIQASNYVEARTILDALPESDEVFSLLGLSYLQEGEDKPLGSLATYLKLAFSYYERLSPANPKRQAFLVPEVPGCSRLYCDLGKRFIEQGDIEGAKKALEQSLEREKNPEALSHLAVLLSLQNQNIRAVHLFDEYFALEPNDLTVCRTYAQALCHIQHYGKALKQYQRLEKGGLLTSSDAIDYLAILIHLGNFKKAHVKAYKLLARLTPKERLKLALTLIPLQDTTLEKKILEGVASEEDAETTRQMLAFLIERGELEPAQQLVRKQSEMLQRSAEGLLLLARLNAKLSHSKSALKFAKEAEQKNPNDPEIQSFLEMILFNPKEVERREIKLQIALKRDSSSTDLLLEKARLKIDTAIVRPVDSLAQLREADAILNAESLQNIEIPRLYFLKGLAAFLRKENEEAEKQLQKALALDVSYVEAYKFLALVYTRKKQENQALDTLVRASHFSPHDAELKKEIADLKKR